MAIVLGFDRIGLQAGWRGLLSSSHNKRGAAMATSDTELHEVSLEDRARITERPAEPGIIVAYAFSQGGALLDMRTLDQEGNASLTISVGRKGSPCASRPANCCDPAPSCPCARTRGASRRCCSGWRGSRRQASAAAAASAGLRAIQRRVSQARTGSS
jgi:hypothetical protein